MSYILDALKKAAEQRDAHAPAMRRLFSPAPEIAESPRWRLAVVGGAAAVAGAVLGMWALWPATSVVTQTSLAPPATARVEPEAPPVVSPPPPAPPAVHTAPKPSAPVKAAAPEQRPGATREARQVPVDEAPPAAVQTRQAPVEPAPLRPQPVTPPTPPPVIAAARPAPIAPAPPAVATPRADAGGAMRLEVIVYSDERARRLAFINGRKYVEGDVLGDGSRIQEIQPDAVVIIDDGRRVVLRP